jgi:hypothetical protein
MAALCDDARQELRGKVSLMGIFSRFLVTDFSQPMPPFRIFAKLGFEDEGDHQIAVELRTSEGQRIFQVHGLAHVQTKDQVTNLYTAEINLGIDSLKLPRPGSYEFAFLCNNQVFHVLPFDAEVVRPPLVQ